MAKTKGKPLEAVNGGYTPMPHAVLDSVAFKGASHTARSLLYELLRQHTGFNNGHLHLAQGWLRRRGWKSGDTIQRAKVELIERELIVQTKQGGLNIGACRFALTWVNISNFVGLEIRAAQYHRGAWNFMDTLPLGNCKGSSATRIGSSPPSGAEQTPASPPDGSKTTLLSKVTSPPDGNNECLPPPTVRTKRPVVGKKGASGIKRSPLPV